MCSSKSFSFLLFSNILRAGPRNGPVTPSVDRRRRRLFQDDPANRRMLAVSLQVCFSSEGCSWQASALCLRNEHVLPLRPRSEPNPPSLAELETFSDRVATTPRPVRQLHRWSFQGSTVESRREPKGFCNKTTDGHGNYGTLYFSAREVTFLITQRKFEYISLNPKFGAKLN